MEGSGSSDSEDDANVKKGGKDEEDEYNDDVPLREWLLPDLDATERERLNQLGKFSGAALHSQREALQQRDT